MAGFFKKVFSFGKKEVVEKPVEDAPLAPINWDALKEFKSEAAVAEAPVAAPTVPKPSVPELVVEDVHQPLEAEAVEIFESAELPSQIDVDAAPQETPRFPEPPAPDLPAERPRAPKLPAEAPAPVAPDDKPTPDLPVEVPAEPKPETRPQPVTPPAPEPEVPPAPEPVPQTPEPEVPTTPEPVPTPVVPEEIHAPVVRDEAPVPVVPDEAPAPELPVEVPAEPEAPVEIPAEPVEAPAEPEAPTEIPAEPEAPVEVPAAPRPSTPPVAPAAPIEIPVERAPIEVPGAPAPRPTPEVPIEIPERPRPETAPVALVERDAPEADRDVSAQPDGLSPGPAPVLDTRREEAPAAGSGSASALDARASVSTRPADPDALGQIDWEGLKAFRRQDKPEPEPQPTSKVTVAKKVEQKQAPVAAAPPPAPRVPWFQRLREGLARSSRELSSNIAGVFTKRKLDEDTLQDLEDVLLRADLGMETAMRVTDTLASTRYGKEISDIEVRTVMAAEVEKVLTPVAQALELDLSHKPHVILVVGVNGTGKTTTIGKLAAKLKDGGLSVMLAAGDTFRAAAIEQLKIWGERTGSPVISSKLGADAAGLAFDAFVRAREEGSDVLIIDTAGRLQNKTELMAELEKIVRVLNKHDPEAPHTVLQTVDATTGQNALNQVEIFRNVAGVNGLVMTKLDGTARGGILVAIAAKHKLPVYFIGVGEQVDDLEPFSAGDFAKAIAGVG